jgi:hypothetical protein
MIEQDLRGTVPGAVGLRLARTREGQIIARSTEPGSIAIFDSRGNYTRSIGGRGDGPGELRAGALTLFVDENDNVLERDNSFRLTLFSQSGEFINRHSAANIGADPGYFHLIHGGRFLTSSWTRTSGPTRHFRTLSRDGGGLFDFGPTDTIRSESRLRRPIAYAGGESFWAGPVERRPSGMDIEEWALDGTLLRTLRLSPAWWPRDGQRTEQPDEPPLPVMSWIHADSSGLLLIQSVTAAAEWRATPAGGNDDEAELQMYDVHLTVVDPSDGVVVASQSLKAADVLHSSVQYLFPQSSVGYRIRELDDGRPSIEVVRYRLVRLEAAK